MFYLHFRIGFLSTKPFVTFSIDSQKQKKKGKKHKVPVAHDGDAPSTSAGESAAGEDSKAVANNLMKSGLSDLLLKRLTNVMLVSGTDSLNQVPGTTKEKRCKNDYRFWRTQPVPDLNEEISENGPIEPDKTIDEIRPEPYSLPDGFLWCEVSLDDEKQVSRFTFFHFWSASIVRSFFTTPICVMDSRQRITP
ncbi:unnamed protein product [Echinostoma caproni]|uniref:Myristoyl-CoA:protein N-myristoyltransferase n=1 Tax=Echinostoma caproni TaxID=27848 RepID=A0A183AUS7_9TREM|nr:unnamed protein product [Echinostoma caproni]